MKRTTTYVQYVCSVLIESNVLSIYLQCTFLRLVSRICILVEFGKLFREANILANLFGNHANEIFSFAGKTKIIGSNLSEIRGERLAQHIWTNLRGTIYKLLREKVPGSQQIILYCMPKIFFLSRKCCNRFRSFYLNY